MIFKNNILKADNIGALAGFLCLIHCIATPLLFVVKACTASCCASDVVPGWWKFIDYVFLIVSFLAIYYATKKTAQMWIKVALWLSWVALAAIILNEFFEFVLLSEQAIYIPALAIVGLHLYNRKYGSCSNDECCDVPSVRAGK